MKNNKGLTIVELVVSMTILVIISIFLFQMIISLKELYVDSGVKTELLNKQALISKVINEDFINNKIEMAIRCNDSENCLALYFADGTRKTMQLIKKTDSSPAYFIYGDYKTTLVDSSDFGNYEISNKTINLSSELTNDSILKINIPIKHPSLRNQDFGINIVYQYDSTDTSIADLSITGNSSADSIWLAGSSDMIWYNSIEFEEPGYYYLDSNNNLTKATESTDEVLVVRSSIVDDVMTITYQSKDDPTKMVTRTVTFINSEYTYTYNSSHPYYLLNVPVNGTYKVELWGANGNSNSLQNGGIGAYTSGTIELLANEKLYVYVGSTGSGDNGGYNGGGSITTNQSLHDGAPGGGSTDVRLNEGAWDSEEGLRSRIMVAAGGGGASSSDCGSSVKTGGAGGNISSYSFETSIVCNDGAWTLASGATQTAGGYLDVYEPTTGTKTLTAPSGVFGMVNTPTGFEGDIKSGGGSGYFGGSSSGHGSPATGGSSFVSGCDDCKAVDADGNSSNANIHYSGKVFDNIIMFDGNNISSDLINPSSSDNGYARIVLISMSH